MEQSNDKTAYRPTLPIDTARYGGGAAVLVETGTREHADTRHLRAHTLSSRQCSAGESHYVLEASKKRSDAHHRTSPAALSAALWQHRAVTRGRLDRIVVTTLSRHLTAMCPLPDDAPPPHTNNTVSAAAGAAGVVAQNGGNGEGGAVHGVGELASSSEHAHTHTHKHTRTHTHGVAELILSGEHERANIRALSSKTGNSVSFEIISQYSRSVYV